VDNALPACAFGKGPFLAARSYGPADDLLFHGRDADAAALSQFIGGRPFAVLTAPSGTGKTSLLQAKVLPRLESERWLTVFVRPHGDPQMSMKKALCEHLIPDPAAEGMVVACLMREVPGQGSATMQEAMDWYSAQSIPRRIALRHFAPGSADDTGPLPMVSRALRGSITLCDLIEHFEALLADGELRSLSPYTPLATLADILESNDTRSLWQAWCAKFDKCSRISQALQVFTSEWAPLRPGVNGTVIVLDQVEELFTLLTAGNVDEFLADMAPWVLPRESSSRSKPTHLTLSLRKEFYADIVPHVMRFGSIERMTFFLNPLRPDEALEAFGAPARLFGIEFEPPTTTDPNDPECLGCLPRILTLAVEEGSTFDRQDFCEKGLVDAHDSTSSRFSPTIISLLGAHLWDKLQAADPPIAMPLTWNAFRRLIPDLDDVFVHFLDDALAYFARHDRAEDSADRFDALEFLDQLATPTGYRNIVAEVELLDKLHLPRREAIRLIDDMDQKLKLVRRERRGRGRFVEIMHERLIAPVRRLLSDSRRLDLLRAALGQASDVIRRLEDDPIPTRDPLPSPHLREALMKHLDRSNLDRLAAKNLMRSMLCAGPPGDPAARSSPEARAGWKATLTALAACMEQPHVDGSKRLPLLKDQDLDSTLASALRGDRSFDGDDLRHLMKSALSDRTEAAGLRIKRALRILEQQEYRL
jgi:hypothetical protein